MTPEERAEQNQPANDVSLVQFAGTGMTITAEAIERLIEAAQYKQHPYGRVWQRYDLDNFQELVGNINHRGLDQEMLLYQGMILEGWHRYLACLATKTPPKFKEFKGTDLEAAELVHASGIRRQSRPDQRYASFLLLCDACPDFKAKCEALKQKGVEQQEAGTPLSMGGQRVDVVGAKAAAAGVGRSTAAKVDAVRKHNPEAVAEIAAGKTSANKELKKNKKGKGLDGPKGKKPDFKVGDVVYIVDTLVNRVPSIKEWKIVRVGKDGYLCTDGGSGKAKRFSKYKAETRERAVQEWKANLKEVIETEVEGVKMLKEKLRRGPKIESLQQAPGQ
jgi:hypothetical protein